MSKYPDIRIGLVGLRESGKTHLIAIMPKIYWGTDQDTSLKPADKETAKLFIRANRILLEQSQFMPPNAVADCFLYSMYLERSANSLGLKGFRHYLQILDFAGEFFLNPDHHIYSSWLAKCNVLLFLIDGKQLYQGRSQGDPLRRKHISLLTTIRDILMFELREQHLNKNKIFIGFCVTKFDQFEVEKPQRIQENKRTTPEVLMRERLFPIYEMVEQLRTTEGSWISIDWYDLSSIGYAWDEQGRFYLDREEKKTNDKSGKRVSQYHEINGKKKLHRPEILRPEGMQRLFEDIRHHVNRNSYDLPQLSWDDIEITRSISHQDQPSSWSPTQERQRPQNEQFDGNEILDLDSVDSEDNT